MSERRRHVRSARALSKPRFRVTRQLSGLHRDLCARLCRRRCCRCHRRNGTRLHARRERRQALPDHGRAIGKSGTAIFLSRSRIKGQLRLWTFQAVAHGAMGVNYFRWDTADFGAEEYWHGILNHDRSKSPRLRRDQANRERYEVSRNGNAGVVVLGRQRR